METVGWNALKRGWYIVLVGALLGAAVGLAVVDRVTPTFQSTVQLLPTKRGIDTAEALAVSVNEGGRADDYVAVAQESARGSVVEAVVSLPAVDVSVESDKPEGLQTAANAVAAAVLAADLEESTALIAHRVLVLEARIADVDSEVDSLTAELNETIAMAAAAEADIEEAGEEFVAVATRADARLLNAEADQIQLERERLTVTASALRADLEDLRILAASPEPNLSVLSPASDVKQVSIGRRTGAYLGFIAGAMVAACLVAAYALTLGRVASRDDFEAIFGAKSLLAVIPTGKVYVRGDGRRLSGGSIGLAFPQRPPIDRQAVLRAIGGSGLLGDDERVCDLGDPSAEAVEVGLAVVVVGLTRRITAKRLAARIDRLPIPILGLVEVHE